MAPVPFYYRILVKNLNHLSEDEFSAFCFENGAEGVYEDLAFTQPDLVYQAEAKLTERINVNIIFTEPPSEDFFLKLESEFSDIKVERFKEKNRDWLEEWKKGFEPFLFVDPFWIVPSWREVPKEAQQFITMEPGMAFGTGTHETTKLAATLVVKHWPKDFSPRVIDVGTGTGLLAIIAEKMGSTDVVGVDNDPEALRVAKENIEINRSKAIVISEKDISQVEEHYDIVIANIIDGILLAIKPDLLRVRAVGAKVVLSGILKEREENFISEFLSSTDLKVIERCQDGEWTAFLLT